MATRIENAAYSREERKAANRVRMQQIGGDDGYQWCVLVDGRIKWNGMRRTEAAWRRKQEIAQLVKVETGLL